jgi:hypothetical protein
MLWGPAGFEVAERQPIPAASGRLAFAAVFGAVEKRRAETHMPLLHAVAQRRKLTDWKQASAAPYWVRVAVSGISVTTV